MTVAEFDPQHPDRLPLGYEIFYEVRYQYLPLPIPISFTATERLPSQGTIFVDLTPDVFTERDDCCESMTYSPWSTEFLATAWPTRMPP